jgi:hypothetical protein
MPVSQAAEDQVAQRGQELYEQQIRPKVEANNKGKLLVINVETGEYEMDADDGAALERARARFPNAELFAVRVGHPTAYRIGGRFRVGLPR